jgi:hypothetical protein
MKNRILRATPWGKLPGYPDDTYRLVVRRERGDYMVSVQEPHFACGGNFTWIITELFTSPWKSFKTFADAVAFATSRTPRQVANFMTGELPPRVVFRSRCRQSSPIRIPR